MLARHVKLHNLKIVHRFSCLILSAHSSGQADDDSSYKHFQPLGDQKAYYTQYQRQNTRVSGDKSFRRPAIDEYAARLNRNTYRANQHQQSGFRGNNVSGFGGRMQRLPNSMMYAAGAKLRDKDWSKMNLTPINKNIYKEHPDVANISVEDIKAWLNENECHLIGKNLPRPIFKFEHTNFSDQIVNLLADDFEKPTEIQSISWPMALSGLDLISIAKTGSGKTLAFVLPAISHALSQQRLGQGPSVLILLPTRELALQVAEVSERYCHAEGLRLVCCYGGADKSWQISALQKGVDICLGTPGRLLDLLEGGYINLQRCTFIVLDEADRMLDMGFEPQIRKVIGQIRPDRQTLMFSATWPKEVRALAADFQTNPVHLTIGSLDLAANHNICQHIEIVEEHKKHDRLIEILTEAMSEDAPKILVFMQTKRNADQITSYLRRNGLPALSIHGDKSQSEREWALKEFKGGKTAILIATDVAARGLDVNDIKHVINCDYPGDIEMYVHRIGRTGRQNKKGTSYTLLTPQEASMRGRDLIKVLEEAGQEVPDDLRDSISERRDGNGTPKYFRSNYQGRTVTNSGRMIY